MRIQIKVYLDAKDEASCEGVKPDFWENVGSFEDAEIVIAESKARAFEKELGIVEKTDDMDDDSDDRVEPDTNDSSQFPAEGHDMRR